MGATNIYVEVVGDTMKKAYDKVVEAATYDYGHDAYNGSINTTSGFVDRTSRLEGECGDDLHKFEDLALSNTNKWEECWGTKISDKTFVFVGWAAE